MDLEERLEDLLDDATGAARRQARRVNDSTRVVRRRARRTVRAVGGVSAAVLLLLAIAMANIGDPGGVQLFLALMALVPALVAGGAATAAHLADRRDPQVQRQRALAQGLPDPTPVEEELHDLPRDVRRDWDRLLQARRLVQDLAHEAFVEARTVMEVDGMVARLHRLLVADRRATRLGGRASTGLRTQVAELADLLVALADEAVQLQVETTAGGSALAATLADAHENLVLLREARQEVRRLDAQPQAQPGV